MGGDPLNLRVIRAPFVIFVRLGRRWQVSDEIVNAQQFFVFGERGLQHLFPERAVHSAGENKVD